jgi:hypothetical protein
VYSGFVLSGLVTRELVLVTDTEKGCTLCVSLGGVNGVRLCVFGFGGGAYS